MVGQLTLDQHIGVRIPGGQPNSCRKRDGMRIAIVSDIHGNLNALEAVITALNSDAPDLVLHGGDLAHGGAHPVEVVDRIRELGWRGVLGNTDELLWRSESLPEAAEASPGLRNLVAPIQQMASWTREQLGQQRLDWLSALPLSINVGTLAVVHASPASCWTSPLATAPDPDLRSTFEPLGAAVASYGHIHTAFTRKLDRMTVANSGSAGMSLDGDPRASYLLIDGATIQVRRIEYDLEREIRAVTASRMPHADWTARIIRSAKPEMP